MMSQKDCLCVFVVIRIELLRGAKTIILTIDVTRGRVKGVFTPWIFKSVFWGMFLDIWGQSYKNFYTSGQIYKH